MKNLKNYKTFENSSPVGSIEVDIANLSSTSRYNNANPAIELEEEIGEEIGEDINDIKLSISTFKILLESLNVDIMTPDEVFTHKKGIIEIIKDLKNDPDFFNISFNKEVIIKRAINELTSLIK